MRHSTLARILLATIFLSGALAAPSLYRRGNSLCGCDGQCADKGGKCFPCASGGWNCGADSTAACGVPGLKSAGACPPAHDLCGCDGQCTGKGDKCFPCAWGGWNCGKDSVAACGVAGLSSAGACPPAHDLCGCDDQCASKGGKCFPCAWGGWNCGADSTAACGVAGLTSAGKCPTTPPPPPPAGECTTGQKRCFTAGKYQNCNNNKWADVQNCAAATPNCIGDGVCSTDIAKDCTQGQMRCFSTTEQQSCTNGGWDTLTTCGAATPVCTGDGNCQSQCDKDACLGGDQPNQWRQCLNHRYLDAQVCADGKTCISKFDGTNDGCAVCAAGTTQCKGTDTPQTCDASGQKWNDGAKCAAGQTCTMLPGAKPTDPQVATCISCTPGTYRCNPDAKVNTPEVCDATGTWVPNTAACAGTDVCMIISGKSKCVACTPGEKTCNGLQISTCSASGTWDLATNCAYGSACSEIAGNVHKNGTSAACLPYPFACDNDATKCSGSDVQTCKSRAWATTTTCKSPNPACAVLGGKAQCAQCVPADGTNPAQKQCYSSTQWQACKADGTWDTTLTACTNPKPHCSAGECVA